MDQVGQAAALEVTFEPLAFELSDCGRDRWEQHWEAPSQRAIGYPDFEYLVALVTEEANQWLRVEADEPFPLRDTGESANPDIPESEQLEGFYRLEPTDAAVLRSRPYFGYPDELDLAVREHEAGSAVWLGIREHTWDDRGYATFVVETPEGQVIPVGRCRTAARALLEVEDAPAVFEALISGETEVALAELRAAWADAPEGGRPRPDWDQVDPAVRSVADAPPDVAASLRQVNIVLAVPEAWKRSGWLVCPRVVGVGLGTCLDLGNAGLAVDAEGLTTFTSPVSAEQPVEIVLRREGAVEATVLATVPAAQAIEGITLEVGEAAASRSPDAVDAATASQSVTVTGPYVPGGGIEPAPEVTPPTTR